MSASVAAMTLLISCAPVNLSDQQSLALVQPADASFAAYSAPHEDERCPPEQTGSAKPLGELNGAQQAPTAEQESEELVVTARRRPPPEDPMQGVNLKTFAVAQAVDGSLVRPVALGYAKTVPEPARMGVRNFFRNLHEPVVFLNFLLQLKPGRAIKTLGRFAINTTVGGAGLFDMAKKKPFNLPYHSNGFGNTLAYYGVKPGPFLFLPVIGPTTVRDLFGLAADTTTMPTAGLQPITGTGYTVSSMTFKAIDARAEGDDRLQKMVQGNPNAYATIRQAYLARREAEIAELHSPAWLAKRKVAPAAEVAAVAP
jgi:phospholipid-binding lipoprotein MlaA